MRGLVRGGILLAGLALPIAALAQAPAAAPAAAAAPQPAADPLIQAFEAADRGELAPLQQLLAGAGGDRALLIRARLAAARFQREPAHAAAVARLAGSADPVLRRAALSIQGATAFVDGRYGEAARAGQALERALAEAGEAQDAAGVGRMHRLAALLTGQPAQQLEGAVATHTIPAWRDQVGLPRIGINVNGQPQEAVFDTGANLSVLSAETARRLGVTILDTPADIGNGVDGTVPARIGIADRIEIAGTTLRNVAFLIIDDANLSFPQVPGGYDIKAIVGLPVMRALGRFRMEAARFSVLPPAPASAASPNLSVSGNLLYVDAEIDGRPVPLLLDTGANQTSLSALYAEANAERVAALEARTGFAASAGGARAQRVATWANVPVALGGRTLVLPSLSISLPDPAARPPRGYGTIGASLLRAFQSYTIDFGAMRFELGEPVRPAS